MMTALPYSLGSTTTKSLPQNEVISKHTVTKMHTIVKTILP